MEHCLDCDYKWNDDDNLYCSSCFSSRIEQYEMLIHAHRYAQHMNDRTTINSLGQTMIDGMTADEYFKYCALIHGKDRFNTQIIDAFNNFPS